MNETTIFNKIQAIIADQLDKQETDVQMETSFKNDLEADSLDVFEIINEIEDQFDVTIDTDENMDTVGELVQYIAKAA
jgi:acyl carrier protein